MMKRHSDDGLRGSHQCRDLAISQIFEVPQGEHLGRARRQFTNGDPEQAAELSA